VTSLVVRAFLTLFVVIDPIGLGPIFVTLAGNRSPKEQVRIARQAILVAGGIMLAFALGGPLLLSYLGISIEAFQVAAGVLLFKIAVDMVFAQRERETEVEEKEAQLREDISIFPLAIPIIAGPGTLASILILVNEANAYSFGLIIVLAIAGIVLLIAYTLLCLSARLARLLGQTGINVVTRVLGVLLSALAVQYIANGVVVLLAAAFR
jgi:multiple antibiotic resistance protein